jgi:eukaryotic-like serine/threonine-protein kinase
MDSTTTLFGTLTEDQISATHALKGRTLQTKWKVIERVKFKPGSTGGNFSVCYIVERDGQIGFLKALNVLSFLRDDKPDLLEAMAEMINTYNFEKEILTRCKNKNLSKVSRLLEAGQENIPGFLVANVYYMIFEKADSDVREHMNFTNIVDNSWKLRSLHNVATGIKQLHGIDISHQDVKPSNVFVFDKTVSKIGDLGRSLCQNFPSPHSKLDFSGDFRYAPPEVFHGFALPDWKDKVFAVDCFLLGSLATYYFTAQSMTALLSQRINPRINILTLNFEEALPYWVIAYDESMEIIKQHLKDYDDRDKLVESIEMLCYPDPRKRGHIKNRKEVGNNFQLERFVETFNLLASRAEYRITKK